MNRFSQEFKIFQNADRIAEKIFLFLTILFIGFIVFTSCTLVSAPSKSKQRHNVFQQLFSIHALDKSFTYHNLEDIATNVLFYIPLGLFLSLTVSFRKPRVVTLWLLVGFILSASMEVSQYFIGRYADPLDLMTNTVGFIIGFEMGVAAILFFGLRPSAMLGINSDNQTSTKINTIAAIRFLYIVLYLISSFLPFDLVFDPAIIHSKINPDRLGHVRLILDPFYHLKHWRHDAHALTGLFLGLFPVAVLTAILHAFQKRLNIFAPILICVLLVSLCEVGQLFIYSRTTDIAMIPMAFLTGVGGWVIARVWFMLQDYEGYSSFDNERHRNDFLFKMTCGYAAFLAFATLMPFRFEFSLKAITQKFLFQSNWVPFTNQIGLRNIEMSLWLLRDLAAFIPLGLLLTFLLKAINPGLSRWVIMLGVGGASIIFAIVLEILKLIQVGLYIDITAVLLAFLGGLIGCVFFRFLGRLA